MYISIVWAGIKVSQLLERVKVSGISLAMLEVDLQRSNVESETISRILVSKHSGAEQDLVKPEIKPAMIAIPENLCSQFSYSFYEKI